MKQRRKERVILLLELTEVILAPIPLWFFLRLVETLRGSGFSARLNNSVELSQAVELNGNILEWYSLLLHLSMCRSYYKTHLQHIYVHADKCVLCKMHYVLQYIIVAH